MEIYVFDKNLNMQGILGSYTSLIWRRKYSKIGDFELHCALNTDNLTLLQKGNVVWKNDDEEAGYIQYRNISLDANGDEVLVVSGKFLTGYLNRRIVWGIENLDTTSELAIRELIDKNCINPIDIDRKIALIELSEVKGYPQTTNTQTSYTNLLDKVEEITHTSELGIRAILDIENKRIIVDIYEGLDRTSGQSVNAPAIFSKEFENVLEQEYTDSSNNFRNVALVAGEGEGTARELVTVGSGIGIDRFEIFIDARDLQKEEMTTVEYTAKLTERGQEKLAEYVDIETFDSKINLNSNLIYKEDFDLGDKVTCVSKKWGVTINTRITEVEEIYESSGKQINVVFGDSMPTLIDKLKEVIK